MHDGIPAELPAEVAAQIADKLLDLVIEGKHQLWRWEYPLRHARWLTVAGERVLMPSFSDEAQLAVVRVLAHAGPLVVLLQITWPALSDIEPMGLLIVAERVVQASSPGNPGTFFVPTIYHELHAETIADALVAREEPRMSTTYTAIFAESNGWVVGWVRELPGAIAQERTIAEARESLKEVIALLLETREPTDETHIIAREPITVG